MSAVDLVDAAMAGDERRIRWALQAHVDPNASADGVGLHPLHICAAQGHLAACQALIEHDADVAACQNSPGLSPLSMACLSGHREVVRLLVCASAPISSPELDGASPLLRAAERDFPGICEVLIAAGADVNATCRKSREAERVRQALELRNVRADWRPVLRGPRRLSADDVHVEGIAPLHLAARNGSVRICSRLLDAGARPGSTDVLLRSPLALACERGHAETIALLLERMAAVGADVDGQTPGNLAARAGHAAALRVLLDLGALDVDFVPQYGAATMLHSAAHHGMGGSTALLCEADADPGTRLEPGGVTPLMLAAAGGFEDICRELLAYGASTTDVDEEGRTAWVHAATGGHSSTCILLAVHAAPGCAERGNMAAPVGGYRRRPDRERDDVRPPVSSNVISGLARNSKYPGLPHMRLDVSPAPLA